MERDIQRIRETLAQMIQLSVVTERSYRMSVRELGAFYLNGTSRSEQGEVDLLWEYEDGRPIRVTRENSELVVAEYFERLGLELVLPPTPEPILQKTWRLA